MRKQKVSAHLETTAARDLAALAARRRVPATRTVEAAVASFLSPDSADRTEGAITRRRDRLACKMERLDRDHEISGEALALFVRAWLTTTPPLPDDLREAAQSKGRESFGSILETLARRLAMGKTLSRELTREVAAAHSAPEDGEAGWRSGRKAVVRGSVARPGPIGDSGAAFAVGGPSCVLMAAQRPEKPWS